MRSCHQAVRAEICDDDTGRAADGRNQECFGQHMLDDTKSTGAERQAQRDLVLSGRASRQQNAGDVGARNPEEQGDNRHQHEQWPAVLLAQHRDACGGRPDLERRLPPERVVALLGHFFHALPVDAAELHFRLLMRDPWSEPSDHRHGRIADRGHPQVGPQARRDAGQPPRCDADDHRRIAVDADRLAKHRRVAIEPPLPVPTSSTRPPTR